MTDENRIYTAKLLRRMAEARVFPRNTCPASRHAQMIGERLIVDESPAYIERETAKHIGESIINTVVELWECRQKLASYGRYGYGIIDKDGNPVPGLCYPSRQEAEDGLAYCNSACLPTEGYRVVELLYREVSDK